MLHLSLLRSLSSIQMALACADTVEHFVGKSGSWDSFSEKPHGQRREIEMEHYSENPAKTFGEITKPLHDYFLVLQSNFQKIKENATLPQI